MSAVYEWWLDPRARTLEPADQGDGDSCAGCDGQSFAGSPDTPLLLAQGIDPLLMDEEPVWGRTDWQLLRKFATFWPSAEPAPPDFPWLGKLVSRQKAWRWVSQFPRHFQEVQPKDTKAITEFIARTLMDVDPAASEEGDKKCCKKKPKPKPVPEIRTCFENVITCTEEDGSTYDVQQLCCLNDEGGYDCFPQCGNAPEDTTDPIPVEPEGL